MAKQRRIELEDIEFLKDYVGKKILKETFTDMLAEPERSNKVQAFFEKAIRDENIEALNKWIDNDITKEAKTTLLTAARGRGYRKNNPRSEHTLRKSLALEVMEWIGTDDINEAVQLLLEKAKKTGR